jgi:hypothetical protein
MAQFLNLEVINNAYQKCDALENEQFPASIQYSKLFCNFPEENDY